jgi:hypothetical protein
MCKNTFLLSILIPTYNYSYGLDRILKSFINVEKKYLAKVEFLISDDSDNAFEAKKIYDICSIYKEQYKYNLIYFEGTKSSNPIDNWNSLIIKSNGLYRQIIHHDEFYSNHMEIEELLDAIALKKYDIYILKLYSVKKMFIYNHLPNYLIKFLLELFPSFILIKNFIGPSACFVYKCSCEEIFNPELKWLVDTDWYYRLLTTNTYRFISSVNIYSESNRRDSITHRITEFHFLITYRELKALKYKPKIIYLFFLFFWPLIKSFMLIHNFFYKARINDYS